MVLTSSDMSIIGCILDTLNEEFPPETIGFDLDIEVGDSNGDRVGHISHGVEGMKGYAFVPNGG